MNRKNNEIVHKYIQFEFTLLLLYETYSKTAGTAVPVWVISGIRMFPVRIYQVSLYIYVSPRTIQNTGSKKLGENICVVTFFKKYYRLGTVFLEHNVFSLDFYSLWYKTVKMFTEDWFFVLTQKTIYPDFLSKAIVLGFLTPVFATVYLYCPVDNAIMIMVPEFKSL